MTAAAIAEPSAPSFRMWSARPRRGASAVRRPALVQRLADPSAPPLVVVVAPAGSGKTMLLGEWARRDPRPFAWVTVHKRDNDGERMRDAVARAVDEAAGGDADAAFALVVDDAHTLSRHRVLKPSSGPVMSRTTW